MRATQGVILVMLGALLLYLVWSKNSRLAGNAATTVDPIKLAADNTKAIADAAKASPNKTGPTGDPGHGVIHVQAGGLTYTIDAITQGIISYTDGLGNTYKGAPWNERLGK